MNTFDHPQESHAEQAPLPANSGLPAEPVPEWPVAVPALNPRIGVQGQTACSSNGRNLGDVDAPSSNRASIKCTDEQFIPLLQGIDSLELSCLGRTNGAIAAELEEKKKLAQHPDPREQAKAQIEIAGNLFEVCDRGVRRYAFTLRNSAYFLKVLGPGGSALPFVYAQVRNEYLWHVGPTRVRDEVLEIASALGERQGPETIGRIDLFVDFRTSHSIKAIEPAQWITHARKKDSHNVVDEFTGWSIGLKSPTQARIYDKPAEIEAESHKTYLYELWANRGYVRGQSVWRLEFQIRREILKSLGLSSFDEVSEAQPALWKYLTSTFLRLAQVNPLDATRARWQNHPLWDRVSALSWSGNTLELSRSYEPSGIPSDKWLGTHGSSVLSSVMAKHGVTDIVRGIGLFEETIRKYLERRALDEGIEGLNLLTEQVRLKAKRYSTMDNNADLKNEGRAFMQHLRVFRSRQQ